MARADEAGITVTYELFLISSNLEKSRYLLRKFQFELFDADPEVELWIRKTKVPKL
jgi:hypothetical protein